MASNPARQPLTGNVRADHALFKQARTLTSSQAEINGLGRASMGRNLTTEDRPSSTGNTSRLPLAGLEATPGSHLRPKYNPYSAYGVTTGTNTPTESTRFGQDSILTPKDTSLPLNLSSLNLHPHFSQAEDPPAKIKIETGVWGVTSKFALKDEEDHSRRNGSLLLNSEPYHTSSNKKNMANGMTNGFSNGLSNGMSNSTSTSKFLGHIQRQDSGTENILRGQSTIGLDQKWTGSFGHFPHLSDASNSTQPHSPWNDSGSVHSPTDDRRSIAANSDHFSHHSSRNNSLPPSRHGGLAGPSFFPSAAQTDSPFAPLSRDSNQNGDVAPGTRNGSFGDLSSLTRHQSLPTAAASRDVDQPFKYALADPIPASLLNGAPFIPDHNAADLTNGPSRSQLQNPYRTRRDQTVSQMVAHKPFANSSSTYSDQRSQDRSYGQSEPGLSGLSNGQTDEYASEIARPPYTDSSLRATTNGTSGYSNTTMASYFSNGPYNTQQSYGHQDLSGVNLNVNTQAYRSQSRCVQPTPPQLPSTYGNAGLPHLQYLRQGHNPELYGPLYNHTFNLLSLSSQQWAQQQANMLQQFPYMATPNPPTPPRSDRIQSPLLTQYRAWERTHPLQKNPNMWVKGEGGWTITKVLSHAAEFAGDQKGSRLLQKELTFATEKEKVDLGNELKIAGFYSIMNDTFGNYVMQKLVEYGTQDVKRQVAAALKGHALEMSKAPFGTRVVQEVLRFCMEDDKKVIMSELQPWILELTADANGNHVIQAAVEYVDCRHIQCIFDAYAGQIAELAREQYGCRVIQRIIQHATDTYKRSVMDELHEAEDLANSAFGNYVVQYMLQYGSDEDREKIVEKLRPTLLEYCTKRGASNVVEKCIQYCREPVKHELIMQLIGNPSRLGMSANLERLCRCGFGNYVVRKSCPPLALFLNHQ
jgi:mRNA-binding protein PUF3